MESLVFGEEKNWARKNRAVMDQIENEIWLEDPARELNNQISELQARVAFPNHWSSGEHELHLEKLRQLYFQKRLLSDNARN